jgi:hypothetical protein
MCKSAESSLNDTTTQPNSDTKSDLAPSSSGCFHSTWKTCHTHIISIMHRTLASLNCFICKKLIPNEKYMTHLRGEHQIDKMNVCPLCGDIEDKIPLASHIAQVHSCLSLQDFPDSAFFNLVTTLNSNKKVCKKNECGKPIVLPEDFYVYQCLNCHQFFLSDCSFSHNCWTYNAVVNNTNNETQPLTNNNYFSPIFFKFNVSKVLNSPAFHTTTTTQTNGGSSENNNNKKLKTTQHSDLVILDSKE